MIDRAVLQWAMERGLAALEQGRLWLDTITPDGCIIVKSSTSPDFNYHLRYVADSPTGSHLVCDGLYCRQPDWACRHIGLLLALGYPYQIAQPTPEIREIAPRQSSERVLSEALAVVWAAEKYGGAL